MGQQYYILQYYYYDYGHVHDVVEFECRRCVFMVYFFFADVVAVAAGGKRVVVLPDTERRGSAGQNDTVKQLC